MYKQEQTWLVTMLDLVLLITCFFVLSYAIKMNNIVQKTEIFGDAAIKPDRLISPTSLEIIYNNLLPKYKENVAIIKEEAIVRIIPNINYLGNNALGDSAELLSTHIYNFGKNSIKVSLLIDYQQFSNHVSKKENNIEIAIRKLIEQTLEFRNLLAKNSNNDKIATTIDLHSSYPSQRGKDSLIVVDICGPN